MKSNTWEEGKIPICRAFCPFYGWNGQDTLLESPNTIILKGKCQVVGETKCHACNKCCYYLLFPTRPSCLVTDTLIASQRGFYTTSGPKLALIVEAIFLLPLQLQPSCYYLVCWLIQFCRRLDPGFFLGAQWSLLKTSLATLVKIWLGLI